MQKFCIAFVALIAASLCACGEDAAPEHGGLWPDANGEHINAHGGGILHVDSVYYWYGENRNEGHPSSNGVNGYRSTNLKDWEPMGNVLAVSDIEGHDIERGCVIERPKVVYNPATGKYVMWFHLELKGKGYSAARAGVALADTPEGPFEFIRSGRVNPGIYPENMPEDVRNSNLSVDSVEAWTDQWKTLVAEGALCLRDVPGGQMSRDMTIYIDADGTAYHIYSAEENLTLNIAELDSTYTAHTGRYIRIDPAGHNEAPAVFRHGGKYWMITSGCTGWKPNEARLLSADSMMGRWTRHPNPCRGHHAKRTFGGQSTYVLEIADAQGGENQFIALFDRWRPRNLRDSRYLWLPIQFDESGFPVVTME